MKKTRLDTLPENLSRDIIDFISGYPIYDSSSSPEARVYYIEREGGYYLKRAAYGALKKEAGMAGYFHTLGLSPRVVSYKSAEYDVLLTEAAVGSDLTGEEYLKRPEWLAREMGERLRELHSLSGEGCPIGDRTKDYLASVDEGYKTGRIDLSYHLPNMPFASAEEAYRVITERRGILSSDTLLHGDFCLPNVIYRGDDLSSYIDLGAGGIGDRHIDIFWGAWTLNFNLGTEKYRDAFFEAYGRDRIDPDALYAVAAAEVFG